MSRTKHASTRWAPLAAAMGLALCLSPAAEATTPHGWNPHSAMQQAAQPAADAAARHRSSQWSQHPAMQQVASGAQMPAAEISALRSSRWNPQRVMQQAAQPAGDVQMPGGEMAGGAEEHGAESTPRQPWHLDSAVALLILLCSVATAILLNHAMPVVRAEGTLLASLGCFAIAGLVGFAAVSGLLAEPKPVSLPPDALKPTLLTLQGLLALAAGAVLFWVFLLQWRRAGAAEALELSADNSLTRYGRTSRLLHWVIGMLILLLIPVGIIASMLPEEGLWYRPAFYVVHKSLGLVVLLLVVVRLVWNFVSPRPKLDERLATWERRTASTVHVLLYGAMILLPVSGFVMSTFANHTSPFFFWDIPLLWEANREMAQGPGLMHKVVLPYLFYLLFGAHLLGALKHRYLDRQPDAFTRMVG